MKNGIYSIVKARFLVNQDATKNWRFILFIVVLAIIMIANTHRFEEKVFEITALTDEVKELRSEFVDRRSERMESTISTKMKPYGVVSSSVPPQKIKIVEKEDKNFWQKLWD
jgi:hypothetical protein